MNQDILRTARRRTILKQSAAVVATPPAAPLMLAKPVAGANGKLNRGITGNPEAVKPLNPAARKGWRAEGLA